MIELRGISTALPRYRYSREEILRATDQWLGDSSSERALFERFLTSSAIDFKNFAIPLPQILELDGIGERAAIFQREGTTLGVEAVRAALAKCKLTAEQIDVLIFSSVTIPVVPSIDASIVNALGFRPDVVRIPLYQHGCAGGAVGLSLARSFAQNGQRVMVLAVELCSLGFQKADLRGGSLVGSALFSDGAACAVIEPVESEGWQSGERTYGPQIVDTRSLLIPETEHVMGYDIEDNGTFLRLNKELPGVLSRAATEGVPAFLALHKLKPEDVKWWLFHPGGTKILESLENSFKLAPSQAKWSREILTENGNISSASILFVIERYLNDGVAEVGDYALALGVGPGLTVQLLLLQH